MSFLKQIIKKCVCNFRNFEKRNIILLIYQSFETSMGLNKLPIGEICASHYEASIQTVCCTHTVKHDGWYDKKYTPQCKVRKIQAICLILHKKCCMYRHRRWQCAGKKYMIFSIFVQGKLNHKPHIHPQTHTLNTLAKT